MNFLLDTCVISELIKKVPNQGVVQWMRSKDEENLFLSVITIGEIQKGISKLPDGPKKKEQLQNWLSNELQMRFKNRILAVSIDSAIVWGQVMGRCEKEGISLPAIDSLIAAQALFHRMTIVTRNISDMEPNGVPILNPWQLHSAH